MNKAKIRLLASVVSLALIAGLAPSAVNKLAPSKSHPAVNAGVAKNGSRLNLAKAKAIAVEQPLAFEENRGQVDGKVKFLARAKGYQAFLTSNEIVLRIKGADDAVLAMSLQDAQAAPKVEGQNRQIGQSNYLLGGDRSKWITGVPHFGNVRYQGIYPGIDVAYSGNERQLEYDFVVQPGADPNQIRMAFGGASKIAINKQGDLELQTSAGTTVNHKPVVYQQQNGSRRSVSGEYVMLAKDEIGFKLGEYDHTQTVVIDPVVTVLALIGGTANDEAYGTAVAANVGVFLTGRTLSLNFPTTPSLCNQNPMAPPPCLAVPTTQPVLQLVHSATANYDAFVTKMSVDGTTLLWSTYIGGTGDDAGRAIAVDSAGISYVTGYTLPGASPATGNLLSGIPLAPAPVSPLKGGYDAFIVKLAANGQSIVADTFYGGPGPDQGFAIALDPTNNNVVIGGLTGGAVTPAPAGVQNQFGNTATPGLATTDGFVARFDNNLALLNATYLGGGANDQVNGVAVDSAGAVYAAGSTFAGTVNTGAFPTKNPLAANNTIAGNSAAFVVKLTSNLGTETYGTLFGQGLGTALNAPDTALGIAVDPVGRAYVVGSTGTPSFNVAGTAPVSGAPLATVGQSQGYLAVFNTTPDPTTGALPVTLAYLALQTPFSPAVTLTAPPSTVAGVTGPLVFNGGAWNGVAVDVGQEAYVVGQINLGPAAAAGDLEVQFARYSRLGALIAGSTQVFNGAGADVGEAVAVNPLDNSTFLAGWTTSAAGLVPTGYKIPDVTMVPPATVVAPNSLVNSGGADALFIALTFNDLVVASPVGGAPLQFTTPVIPAIPPGTLPAPQFITVVSSGACVSPSFTAPAFVNVTQFSTVGNQFVFSVQPTAAAVATPGTQTGNITFSGNAGCPVENVATVGVTLTVQGPINLVPTNTFTGLTSGLGSGIIPQYVASGAQTAPFQNPIGIGVGVTTSSGTITNITGSIINKSANFPTGCTLLTVPPGPFSVTAPGQSIQTVNVNAACAATLPQGVYTATIQWSSPNALGPATLPFMLTIGPNNLANQPVTIVFNGSSAPRQTAIAISAPQSGAAFSYTLTYVPNNFVGTALPASAVSIVSGGTGVIPAGGTGVVTVQVNPANLPAGVYSGEFLANNNGNLPGATPQTTVPFIVYVGNGLGLMSPVNSPPNGTGALPTAGAYPVTISVPAGYPPVPPVGPANGQLPNPYQVFTVTGLGNTLSTQYQFTALPVLTTTPVLPATAVTFTAVGGLPCTTFGQNNTNPLSGAGPPCSINMTIDSTLLTAGTSYAGNLVFTTSAATGAVSLSVPVTINATTSPQLVVSQLNPLILSSSTPPIGPALFVPFPASGITLTATAGSTTLSCAEVFVAANGAFITNVTIPAITAVWESLAAIASPFAGGFPINPPGSVPFAAGPATVGTGQQTLQVCANPQAVPAKAATYTSNVTFNGAGVGPITIPVTFVVGSAATGVSSRVGVVRGSPNPFLWILDANGNGVFDGTGAGFDTVTAFGGLAGDIQITGDWSGSGTSKIGVYRSSTGHFLLDFNDNGTYDGTPTDRDYQFLTTLVAGDVPVVGDWNGSGTSKIGIFRPSTGQWFLDTNGNGVFDPADIVTNYGGGNIPGCGLDVPVTGDWNGSGTTKLGIFRCGFLWILDSNGNGAFDASDAVFPYGGIAGDVPVVGDWSGDGISKVGIFRAGFLWILDLNNDHQFTQGTDRLIAWGGDNIITGDVPVVGKWKAQ